MHIPPFALLIFFLLEVQHGRASPARNGQLDCGSSIEDDVNYRVKRIAPQVEQTEEPVSSTTSASAASSTASTEQIETSSTATTEQTEPSSPTSSSLVVTRPALDFGHLESKILESKSVPSSTSVASNTESMAMFKAHTEVAVVPTPVAAKTTESNGSGQSSATSPAASPVQQETSGRVESPAPTGTNDSPQAQPDSATPEGQFDTQAEDRPSQPEAAVPLVPGTFTYGTQTLSFSAGPSAVAINGQPVTAGQTLTVDSTPLVVSNSGSSFYLQPAPTTNPADAGVSSASYALITATLSAGASIWLKTIEATRNGAGILVAVTSAAGQEDWASSPTSTADVGEGKQAVSTATPVTTTSALSESSASGSASPSGSAAHKGTGSRSRDGFPSCALAAMLGVVAGGMLLL